MLLGNSATLEPLLDLAHTAVWTGHFLSVFLGPKVDLGWQLELNLLVAQIAAWRGLVTDVSEGVGR